MKNARYIVATLAVLIAIAVLCPHRITHTRAWGGHWITATWEFGEKRTLRIVLSSNKYYTGAGVFLPGSKQSWCDYAVAFNSDSLYSQYSKGSSPGVKTLIDF